MHLMFIFALLVCASMASYGVDMSTAVSTSSFSCLINNGYGGFMMVRGWCSTGRFDSASITSLNNAHAAGYSSQNTDVYFYPCLSCGNAAGQVDSFWNSVVANHMDFKRLWFDIEGDWYSSQTSNRQFFEQMINEARAIGIVYGIYASTYYWSLIMGSGYVYSPAASSPLWYPHYDNNPSFYDFSSFGGWSSPYIKQYKGTTSLCSASVDLNYGH